MKIGRKAKVIPHALLDKVNDIYTKKRAAVNAALDKAVSANNVGTPEKKQISGLGSSIDKANADRKAKKHAARKARNEARKKARDINRRKRLASLRAANLLQNSELVSLGKCLDVSGRQINKDGANVHLWNCHGGSNQKWWYTKNREIRVTGGKCLDVSGNKNRNGANIIIWRCHGGANQQWRFDRTGRLVGLGGRCLDVSGNKSANGTNIHLWQCHNGKNQKWTALKRKFTSLRWIASSSGKVPRGAISGGSEKGRSRLYVCRVKYKDGTHPGKIVGRNCNIGWGGKEITISKYEVLTGDTRHISWANVSSGRLPKNVITGGSERGRRLYLCRAKYKNGTHPGKVVAGKCNIGWGGKERVIRSYQVMVTR
ncbi:MAG: hypothetical protein CMM52_14195 [Rhodospirillaceae bacterium]|nr:hypothetical protein [Rhodospirillaceae bacterium]|tara:strand:+ start:56689 stop:57801 length:1113 start_codon:yes stop_codon:yes gene_type:complete